MVSKYIKRDLVSKARNEIKSGNFRAAAITLSTLQKMLQNPDTKATIDRIIARFAVLEKEMDEELAVELAKLEAA